MARRARSFASANWSVWIGVTKGSGEAFACSSRARGSRAGGARAVARGDWVGVDRDDEEVVVRLRLQLAQAVPAGGAQAADQETPRGRGISTLHVKGGQAQEGGRGGVPR